jgi:hypothetical protein
MLRRMMIDQRSASSSDARAIGQYWPWLRIPTGSSIEAAPQFMT